MYFVLNSSYISSGTCAVERTYLQWRLSDCRESLEGLMLWCRPTCGGGEETVAAKEEEVPASLW